MNVDKKPTVLIMCTGNSCRSQMAEGFFRALAGDRFSVFSAGMEPKAEIHPMAVQAMKEIGIDISRQYPKSSREFLGKMAVTHHIIVCDQAERSCPRTFVGITHRHFWPFSDPAAATGADEERLAVFRTVRDQIRGKIESWLLEQQSQSAIKDAQ